MNERNEIRTALLGLVGTDRPKRVDLPGLTTPLYVRSLSSREFDRLLVQIRETKYACSNARYVSACLCDEDGAPIFDVENEAEVLHLSGVPARYIDCLYQAASKINELDADTIKELEGNSEATPSADSGSG